MGVQKKNLTTAGDFPVAAGEALRRPAPPVAASALGPAAQQSTHLEWVRHAATEERREGLRRRGVTDRQMARVPLSPPSRTGSWSAAFAGDWSSSPRLAGILGREQQRRQKEAARGRGGEGAARPPAVRFRRREEEGERDGAAAGGEWRWVGVSRAARRQQVALDGGGRGTRMAV